MNWVHLHLTYQLVAVYMTDELAFKGYSPPSHASRCRQATPASRLARSAPGALLQKPSTQERASVCDVGVTFSKGASELRLVAVPPHLPHLPKVTFSFKVSSL